MSPIKGAGWGCFAYAMQSHIRALCAIGDKNNDAKIAWLKHDNKGFIKP